MGRDHTIYAVAPGFVRFYVRKFGFRDRRYIGLVLNRGEKLPRDEASLGRSRHFPYVELNGVDQPTAVVVP
jgi:large subunit ribosomal protein L27